MKRIPSVGSHGQPEPRRALRVLHLLGGLNPSGMERMLVSGAPHFRDQNVESIVVGQGSHHPYAAELRAAGYILDFIPPVRSVKGARALQRVIRSRQVDVVHIHSESGYSLSAAAARFSRGRPAVIRTVHNVFKPEGRARFTRKLQSAIGDKIAHSVIAPSPDVQLNEANYGRTTTLIYNWISDRISGVGRTAALQLEPGQAPSALIVGNCSIIKNHDFLLEQLYFLGFDLYHHGAESGASKEESRWLNKFKESGRLRYRGVGDPVESLLQASVFVMPSKQEGMPVALAEAISVGLPCLVNDVPGLRWARSVRGVRVVPNDSQVWNVELQKFADHQSNFALGELAPDFQAERGVGQYVRLYREAATTRRRSR
ncbi:glycosyltransferase [Cryobacterium sp. Y11]|uniref:glycosyltransferase n=1 Tax=Cryobacterium sp. Y11 TaxID=2045016 RepID=UPI000CE437DE|nr:glycosyltransferase [Cryobacterium sp. Y11]